MRRGRDPTRCPATTSRLQGAAQTLVVTPFRYDVVMSNCSVSGCDRKTIARGYCTAHYRRWKIGADLGAPIKTQQVGRVCDIDGCGRKHAGIGLCRTHWMRQKTGTPMDQPVREVFETDDLGERLRRYAPPSAPDDCWVWTRALNKGYGMISIGNGKLRGAHIVAWELANDRKLPKGMVIRHRCDNPPCCNPAHLLLGTHGDNVQDRVERGPSFKGEGNARAKLTDEDIASICEQYAAGVSQRPLADQFGVSQGLISMIVRGKGWTHVGGERIPEGTPPRHFKITEDDVRKIREMYARGSWSQKRLAHHFGISRASISGIVNGKTWATVQ